MDLWFQNWTVNTGQWTNLSVTMQSITVLVHKLWQKQKTWSHSIQVSSIKMNKKFQLALEDDIDRMGKILVKSKSSVGIFNSKYLKLLESKNLRKKSLNHPASSPVTIGRGWNSIQIKITSQKY